MKINLTVTAHEIGLRDEPDYQYASVLDTLHKGDKVTRVDGETYYDPGVFGYSYIKVRYKGRVGYIRSDAVRYCND